MNYLDNFIPDRIRIIKEDRNPDHILEILNKHFESGLDYLKSIYKVELDFRMSEVTIIGGLTEIYELISLLQIKGVAIISFTQFSVRFIIEDFIKKIY